MNDISSNSDFYDSEDFEEFDSCLNYLKKRDAYAHKLLNDPNHKAMLYFLDVLLNSRNQSTIPKLVDIFNCDNFTDDMSFVWGNNAEGLKLFFQRYPALFRVEEDVVSAVSVNSPSNTKSPIIKKLDPNKEIEAVKFFQSKLQKRDEKWILIKSLAGHLSQAEINIREIVGPQSEFKSFLLEHSDTFEVQGDLVSLKVRGPLHRTKQKSKLDRPKSLKVSNVKHERDTMIAVSAPTTPIEHSKNFYIFNRYPTITMESDEYRAVIFLRKVIEKENGSLNLSHVLIYLHKASEKIRNTIGWTKCELQEFIRKNSAFFEINLKEMVSNKEVNKINVMVTLGNEFYDCKSRSLNNQCGNVFHISKLWGIIDLGHHEHVFFEKSIFRHLDDLQRHFKLGETVYFNAILAPKESRAKWRATKVWKECDQDMVEKFSKNKLSRSHTANCINMDCIQDINNFIGGISCNNYGTQNCFNTLSKDVKDELGKILILGKTDSNENYSDPKYNRQQRNRFFHHFNRSLKKNLRSLSDLDYEEDNLSIESILTPDHSSSISFQSETSLPTNTVSTSDTTSTDSHAPSINKHVFLVNSHVISEDLRMLTNNFNQPKLSESASQTVSTGDIMATNLFHENKG